MDGVPLTVQCCTAMMSCYAKNLQLDEAYKLMKTLNLPLLDTTFQAMLKVCANRFDYFHKAFEIVKEMKVHGYTPDRQTYHSLLASCGPAKNLKAADMIIN